MFGMWIRISETQLVNTNLMADVRKGEGIGGETIVNVLWIGLPRWNKFNEPVLEHSTYSGAEADALWEGLNPGVEKLPTIGKLRS